MSISSPGLDLLTAGTTYTVPISGISPYLAYVDLDTSDPGSIKDDPISPPSVGAFPSVNLTRDIHNALIPDRLVDFSLTEAADLPGAANFTITLFDKTSVDVETALINSRGGILTFGYKYGGVSNLQRKFNVMWDSYTSTLEPYGSHISIAGHTTGILTRLAKRTHAWLNLDLSPMTIPQIVKALAKDNGWDLVMEDTIDVKEYGWAGGLGKQLKVFRSNGINDLNFLGKIIRPYSISKDTGDGGYQFKWMFLGPKILMIYGTSRFITSILSGIKTTGTVPVTGPDGTPVSVAPLANIVERTYNFLSGADGGDVISWEVAPLNLAGFAQGTVWKADENVDVYKKYWHRIALEFADLYGVDPSLIDTKYIRYKEGFLKKVSGTGPGLASDSVIMALRARFRYGQLANMYGILGTLTVLGDPSLVPFTYIRINVTTPIGTSHWSSGIYLIYKIVHLLDSSGRYTTTCDVTRVTDQHGTPITGEPVDIGPVAPIAVVP